MNYVTGALKKLMRMETTLSPESIDRFRDSLSEKGRSDQTVKGYSSDLTVMLSDLRLSNLGQNEFESVASRWLNLNRRIVAPKTTRRRLSACRTFAKWAGWGSLLSDYSAPTPVAGDPHPIPEGIPGVERMIAAANKPAHRAMIALCGLCGLRISEALAIRPSDINTSDMVLTVFGKGSKTRLVPISTKAWEAMKESVFAAFIEGTDSPVVGIKDRFARSLVSDLAKRANLQRHVASHDLRATFATALYNKTLDQRLVQEILGHASGDTTQIYIKVAVDKMRTAVEL